MKGNSEEDEFTIGFAVPEYLSIKEAIAVMGMVKGQVVYMRRHPKPMMAAFVKDAVILDEGLFLVLEMCDNLLKENINNHRYIAENYIYIDPIETLLAGEQ